MTGLAVAYYSHDTFGIGHVSRASKILGVLVEAKLAARQMVVTGCRAAHLFPFPPGSQILTLPPLQSVRTPEGRLTYRAVDPDAETKETIAERRRILVSGILAFSPDILMVDTTVRGVGYELDAAIQLLKRKTPPATIIGVFRDLIDARAATIANWQTRDYYGWLDRYYDLILVCGDADVFDFAAEYAFNDSLARRTVQVGYLTVTPRVDEAVSRSEPPDVVISAGGGRDGHQALQTFLQGVASANRMLGRRLRVSAAPGPYAPADAARDQSDGFLNMLSPTAGHLHALRCRAGLCLSMFGYNTACETLCCDTPAIVIPRERPESEQSIRAEIFQSRRLIHVHPATGGSAERLGTTIVSLLGSKIQGEHRLSWRTRSRAAERICRCVSELI